MSTTEAGRLTASGKPDSTHPSTLSLQAVAESARRLDELSCARVVGNAADLVHAAQKAGQPLGTLTPAAVILQRDGSVKLATAVAASGYAAPERLRGGPGDRRSDVFALGVILWEALVHERLFDGPDADAIDRAVLDRPIRPPSELNANVPAELDAICIKALAREPLDRYASAKVMAAEIDTMLGDAGYPESNEQIAGFVTRTLFPSPIARPTSYPTRQTSPLPLPSVLPGTTTSPPAFAPPQGAPSSSLSAPASDPPQTLAASSGSVPPQALAPGTASLPAPAAPTAATRPAAPASAARATVAMSPVPAPVAPLAAAAPAATASAARATLAMSAMPAPAAPVAAPAATASAARATLAMSATPAPAAPPAAPAATASTASAGRATLAMSPTQAPAAAPASTASAGRATLAMSPTPAAATPTISHAPPARATLAMSPTPPAATPAISAAATPSRRNDTAPPSAGRNEHHGAGPRAPLPPPHRSPLASTAFLGSNPSIDPAPAAPSVLTSPPSTPTPVPLAPAAPALVTRGPSGPTTLSGAAPISYLSSRDTTPEPLPAFGPPEMPPPITSPGYAPPAAPPAPAPAPPVTIVGPPLAYARPVAAPSIANAETVGTPRIAAQVVHPPSPQLSRPPGITVTPASPPAALQSADAFEDERPADPAQVVSLRRRDTTGSRDVLAGWGWSTGTVGIVDDSEPLDEAARSGRKRLLIAIGGALAGLLVIAGLAFAFSGAAPADQPTALPAIPSATAPAPRPEPSAALPSAPASPRPEPAPPEPTVASAPETARTEPPTEGAAAQPPGPIAPSPATVDQPPAVPAAPPNAPAAALAPSTPAPPPPKLEPAKPEPVKPEPAKIAAVKPEPAKAVPRAEPTRKLDARSDHKADKQPKRPPPDKIAKSPPRGQPIDPYAAAASRPDPAAAYKTGLQQYVRGDTAAALATFRASAASNPGFAATWRGLGLVYEKQGNKAQARVAYRRYLQLAPTADDAGQIRDRMERL